MRWRSTAGVPSADLSDTPSGWLLTVVRPSGNMNHLSWKSFTHSVVKGVPAPVCKVLTPQRSGTRQPPAGSHQPAGAAQRTGHESAEASIMGRCWNEIVHWNAGAGRGGNQPAGAAPGAGERRVQAGQGAQER